MRGDSGVRARLLSAALLVCGAVSQTEVDCPVGVQTEQNKCELTEWKNTLRPTPPPAGGVPPPVGGCTSFSCTWWPRGEPNPLATGTAFQQESSYGIVAPGFEVGWDGSGWNGMEGWQFDQRVYTEYGLLNLWSSLANKPSGDFTDDVRFSKPLNGATCPGVADGNSAEGCGEGALVTEMGGRAHSCSGSRCACLAFGATKSALCDHTAGTGCVAKESMSQNISIPWNAKELKFKHRRDNPGGMSSLGGWARLVINEPGTKAAVPPACQVCPGASGTLEQGPCDARPCNGAADWAYSPAVCPYGATCPRTSTGNDVLWETRCDSVGNGDDKCSMPCVEPSACTLEELTNYVEETVDLSPYVYDIDAATRIADAPATCATTEVPACAAATADEATCTGAGACAFTPESGDTPASCTTAIVSECASANADAPTCAAAGACTYRPATTKEDYPSRLQNLRDYGDEVWTISFQAHTIDLWSVYIDDLTMTFYRPGCTNCGACNFDPLAEVDDGTCVLKTRGCTDVRSANFDPFANTDPGDMCITFEQGEAETLKDIQLGSVRQSPRLVIPRSSYFHTDDDGERTQIRLEGLTQGVEYPYWSHQVQVSPDGWDTQLEPGGDSPVGFKIKSDFANDLTLLVYDNFGPIEPRKGLLHTARSGQEGQLQVKCETIREGIPVELESNICHNNGLVRTTLKAGEVYTVVVIPTVADDYQDDQFALAPLQGNFDLQIFASRGAIKEIPPVCGNGIVEGALEQCDPRSGAEREWCSPPPCSGIATDMTTYTTGPADFHWYTPEYHCVAAYEKAVQSGSSGVRDDCPTGCEWSGHGGCKGIIASVHFDEKTISLVEGEKAQVTIRRRMPPDWLPYVDSKVTVKVYTSDGEGPNAANAEEDDYDDIKSDEVDFDCSDSDSPDVNHPCREQQITIETLKDETFEYPTEHFFVMLDLECDGDDACSQIAKLEYPKQLRVDIVNDPWAPGEFIVATIVLLCTVMLGLTAWLLSWIKGAHMMRYEKLGRELASNFEDGMPGTISPTSSSASPSFRRSNSIAPGNASPSFSGRSMSIAPGNASPSFNQRRASVLAGGESQNGARRASVAPGQNGARRASVAPGQNGARRASVAPGAERRASIAPGAGGAGRRQRAPSISGASGGGRGLGGMDDGALAALHDSVGGMGQRRTQSDGSRRKGSVSMGSGRKGAGLDLANRMQGGEGGASSSGRRRRGSVKEIEPEDEQPSSSAKASSSGRRRRGSVKEISLEPAKKEITLGRSDSKPKASDSSGRRRRGSVKEVIIPAVKEVTAATAFTEAGKKASSSGRRRRGSVKEIEPQDAIAAAPAPAPQSSGRRRRGSVREIEPEDATSSARASKASSGARRRRGSVNDMIPNDATPKAGAADLASASVTTSRRRRTSVSGVGDVPNVPNASEPRGSGRRASVAAGGSRRASIKPGGADDMDGYPPGVVSKLSGLGDGGSGLSKSRRQRAGGGNTSPMANGSPNKGGRSPKAVSRTTSSVSGSGSDGTASPAARDAPKESSKPKRGGGGYTNAAMFTAMQAALAHSEQVLDENKGLVGKLKLTGAALLGGFGTTVTTIVFLVLTASETDKCEAVTGGKCLAHMVGNGHCDWACNVDECRRGTDDKNDGGDCEFYTSTCRFAWYHQQNIAVQDDGVENIVRLDPGKEQCYFAGADLPPDRLNDNNRFISPSEIGKEPIENNVVMGCFSLDQVGGEPGPDNTPTSFPLKDGKCDPACNFAACGWDGGDCEEFRLKASPQCSEGCYSHMLGNRQCDPECDTESCFFDLRDCEGNYATWNEETAAQAQSNYEDLVLPEALICDRETPGPEEMQCGLMNNADVLQAIYDVNFDAQGILKPLTVNDVVDAPRSQQDFLDECDEDEPGYVYDACAATKVEEYEEYTIGVASNWRSAQSECPNTASAILQLNRETQINGLVATLTHEHECRERCDTPDCGHDAGTCFDDYWCAPGCSHDKLINLVCDQECFTAACGWDAPACNSCDAFVDSEAGLYGDAIQALADTDNESSGGINIMLLVVVLLCGIILVLRIRSTIIVGLDGFFEPLGKSLGRIWSKEDVAPFDPGSVAKGGMDRYTAPLWPIAYAGPLLAEPKGDWMEDEDDYNEDTGRHGMKYRSSAVEYASEDSEPLRLELHQAQTAALATALMVVFMFSFPAISLVAGAQPRLAGATQLTEISIGNLFDPESACRYPLGMHELLSNNLRLIWAESDESSDGKPECGSASLAVHAVLLADVLVAACFLLLLYSRRQDIGRLRSAHPRLSDYCVHVSGLGRGTKMASDIDRMTKQLKWLSEKDHADDATVLPIWQDDLHWAWASLQKAQLDATGRGESARGDVLQSLVHNLEASRANVGYPRPFSGHVIIIFNKQHMARAMLHTYRIPVFQKVLKLLLPGEDLGGGDSEGTDKKKTKVKVAVKRGGDPDDIDWLSLRSGGSASFADTWRGRVASIGALLSLVSVLMLSLAILFQMKEASRTTLEEAMKNPDAAGKAAETLKALAVPPFGGSLLIVLVTELGASIVAFTAARAAPYKAHTFSAQRKSVLIVSSFAQVCMLVLFPYMLLGDPFSWHSAGTVSATEAFGKCKPVIENQVNQQLPGAEFMPGGFAEMTLWLQVLNATLPHVLRLMNISHWPRMVLEAIGQTHGKAHGWEFAFSLETSEAYIVRTVALALCFSVVQPVGIAFAAIGLMIGYGVDRLRATRCTSFSSRSMRRGAGVGDLYDQQVVLTLLQSVVALHALLLCCWLESVRLAENPFIVKDYSLSTIFFYPIVELLLVLISLGGQAQGTVCWLIMSYFLVTTSYSFIPLEGEGPYSKFFGIGEQPGGPNIVILLTIIFGGILAMPFVRPMSWFLGPLDPIEMLTKGKRESDEEAYYTQSEMPFKPKSILDDQVTADVASILGLT